MSKLISIVFAGRNDSYMGDYKWRVKTTLNYMLHNLQQIGRLADAEVLVCDWNSDVPLSRELELIPAARDVVRFVIVPPAIAVPAQRHSSFPNPIAVNTAVRRCQGEFIGDTNGDVLFPPSVLQTMFLAAEGKLPIGAPAEQVAFCCARRQLWNAIIQQKPHYLELEAYLARNRSLLPRDTLMLGVGAPSELHFCHRSLWAATRGLDENLLDWGWNDIDFHMRVTQRHQLIDLANFGGELIHLEHYSGAEGRSAGPPRRMNPMLVSTKYEANDETWGLANEELVIEGPALLADDPPPVKATALPAWDLSLPALATALESPALAEVVDAVLVPYKIPHHERAALKALAWYARTHRPRAFVETGGRFPSGAAVVARCHAGVELYILDSWQPGQFLIEAPLYATSNFLVTSGEFKGYLRYVSGDQNTAVQRLLDNPGAPAHVDLALLRCHPACGNPIDNALRLVRALAPGGALVVVGYAAMMLTAVATAIETARPELTVIALEDPQHTALVLAARLSVGQVASPTAPEGATHASP
jgi:hypothetical protein